MIIYGYYNRENYNKHIKNKQYILTFISLFPGTTDLILHTSNITRCPLSIYEEKLCDQILPHLRLLIKIVEKKREKKERGDRDRESKSQTEQQT